MPSKHPVHCIYVYFFKSMQCIFVGFALCGVFIDGKCCVIDQDVQLVCVDLAMKVLNVRNQCFQAVGDFWEDGSASQRSGRRILSIVKRVNCSILRLAVTYCVPVKQSPFQQLEGRE